MDLELLVKLAGRLRALTEEQFLALRQIIEHGAEDDAHLPNVAQALSDCIDITNAHNERPALRLVR